MFTNLLMLVRQIISNLANAVDKQLDKEDIRLTNIVISADALPPKKGVEPAAFSIGGCVKVPENPPLEISQFTRATDLHEAMLDSVYLGLSTIQKISPIQEYPIVVEIPDRLIQDVLTGKKSTILSPEKVHRKVTLILELCQNMTVDVKFIWKRRNSSPGLRRAVDLAQHADGIKKRKKFV